MAGTDHLQEAGRLLAQDLREIRETRKIALETLLEATRLPRDIMKMFDENALVDHPAFNRVYLRSIVGTYADVIGVQRHEALLALDETLDGRYDGALGRIYLKTDDEASEIGEAGDTPDPTVSMAEDEDAAPEGEDSTLPSKTVSPIRTDDKARVLLPRKFGWIMITAVAILALLIVWFIWMFGGTGSAEVPPVVTIPIDTAEVVREPDWIILGDSMEFEVIAVADVLAPIRITRDRFPRSPYWIEHGDTAHFSAVDRIVFESRFILGLADIRLEGHLLSDSLIGTDGRLVLTRERAQRWLDSLAVQVARR